MTRDLLQALERARVFDLEQMRYAGAPSHPSHQPGFNYFLHRHHARGAPEARTSASGLVVMPEHSGTHIDALVHQAKTSPSMAVCMSTRGSRPPSGSSRWASRR